MWRPESAVWTLSSRYAAARPDGRLRRASNVQVIGKPPFSRVVGFAHPNPLLPGRKRPCMPLRGIKTGQDIGNNLGKRSFSLRATTAPPGGPGGAVLCKEIA